MNVKVVRLHECPKVVQASVTAGPVVTEDVLWWYVGRPSALGNPFRIQDHGRVGAVAQYAEELYEALRLGPDDGEVPLSTYRRRKSMAVEFRALQAEARKARITMLVCWCAPAQCHGDAIARELANGE